MWVIKTSRWGRLAALASARRGLAAERLSDEPRPTTCKRNSLPQAKPMSNFNHSEKATVPKLHRFDSWLRTIPASSTTGWRWRKERMIRTLNIAGRVYVAEDAIAEFMVRAERGEFAKQHVTPTLTNHPA